MKTLEGHEDNVRVLAVGDRYVFSGSWDKTIRVWDLDSLECSKVLEGHLEAVLALSVGDGHLVSGSYDTTVSCPTLIAPLTRLQLVDHR